MIDWEDDEWRNDNASERQISRLIKEGFTFKPNITSGEASDLIGSKLEPDEEEIGILKFFNIDITSKISQTEARNIIKSIFSDSKNMNLWEENQDAFWERQDWLEYFFDTVNEPDTRELYEYKKIEHELFMQVVEEFESQGISNDRISDDFEKFIKRILKVAPQLKA